jgi:1-acyl-sn-glycerol-3-phosphate acyltransferase
MYRIVRAACSGASKILWRVTIEGKGNIPRAGPFILSANHRSNIDTPLVATMTRRKMRFLGKDSMWKYPFTDWFFSNMGGFPVDRGRPDRAALHSCEKLLRAGQPLVMFPEGTRQTGPLVETEHMFEGPAYLAMKCQVPIVPVGIGGSERAMPKGAKFIRFTKIHIAVGEPIPPPSVTEAGRVSRKAVHQLTETLRDRIQELFDRAQIRSGA